MDGNNAIHTGVSFHATLERPVFEVHILQFQQAQFLGSPAGITLDQHDIYKALIINMIPKPFQLIIRKGQMLFFTV